MQLSYKGLIKFISLNHPVHPMTKEKFSTDMRVTVKDYGYKFMDACGFYTLAVCCKNFCKSYWKLQRSDEDRREKPDALKDLPDSPSDESGSEDPDGFGGLTAAGAHIGVGAGLYLQTMKTFTMLFLILAILNIPVYIIYLNGSTNNEYDTLDRSFHYFNLGNIRGTNLHCSSVPVMFD